MTTKVLIVGLGSIGKRHLRIVRESLPHADIRVLRHKPNSETPPLANGCFNSLHAACEFKPEVAVIANPAPFHLEVALALAETGSHLLIEKPIATSSREVDRLLELSRQNRLVLQVGYNLRFLPGLQFFRERVSSGDIGQIFSVRSETGQYLPSWRADVDYRQGVSARNELGGGVLLELSHEIDYLRWIFGEVEWISAWTGQQSNLEIDVEDTAHITLGLTSTEGNSAIVVSLNLDFIRHDPVRKCVVIAENASLRWDGIRGEVAEKYAGMDEWRPIHIHSCQRDESYQRQWQHFLDCVRTGARPLVDGGDGLAVLNVISGAKLSASSESRKIYLSTRQKSLSI